MNKLFLIFIVMFSFIESNAQEKWFSTVEVDFIVPSKTEYSYTANDIFYDVNIDSKAAFALQYSINYQLFNKLSIGAVTGIQNQYGADFFSYRLGGHLRYYFVDSDNVYVSLLYAANFTVDKDKFSSGENIRLGIGFPFLKRDEFNLNINVFGDIYKYNLRGAEPLLFGNEKPSSIFFRSIGIGVGIKF